MIPLMSIIILLFHLCIFNGVLDFDSIISLLNPFIHIVL